MQSVNCSRVSAVAGGDVLGEMEADILPILGFLRQFLDHSAVTSNQRKMPRMALLIPLFPRG